MKDRQDKQQGNQGNIKKGNDDLSRRGDPTRETERPNLEPSRQGETWNEPRRGGTGDVERKGADPNRSGGQFNDPKKGGQYGDPKRPGIGGGDQERRGAQGTGIGGPSEPRRPFDETNVGGDERELER